MKPLVAAAGLLAVATVALAQPAQNRALNLAFNDDGTVTLRAENVTARDVLAEWARQCRCHVVNADRLAGAPITVPIVFERAPQAAVLRSLLRQAAGYALTPRRAGVVSPSDFETIYILPVATAAPAFTAVPVARPSFQVPTAGSPDDEIPPVTPVGAQEPASPTDGAGPAAGALPGTASPAGSTSGGLPTVNVPGVRVVPIAPVSPAPQPGNAPQPASPGSVTPRTP